MINEKEEDKYIIWELVMSFELIMDFTKKIPSLVSLVASIEFTDSLGWNSIFNGLVNKIWEVGGFLSQNSYLSD